MANDTEEKVKLSKKAQETRVRIFDILEFTRSAQLRSRTAALTFGDMIQQAVEVIDSNEVPDGSVRLPFELQQPGKLQELSELVKIADSTFADVQTMLDNPLYGDLEKDTDDEAAGDESAFPDGFSDDDLEF